MSHFILALNLLCNWCTLFFLYRPTGSVSRWTVSHNPPQTWRFQDPRTWTCATDHAGLSLSFCLDRYVSFLKCAHQDISCIFLVEDYYAVAILCILSLNKRIMLQTPWQIPLCWQRTAWTLHSSTDINRTVSSPTRHELFYICECLCDQQNAEPEYISALEKIKMDAFLKYIVLSLWTLFTFPWFSEAQVVIVV